MELSQETLRAVTNASLETSDDMKLYVKALYQLLEFAKNAPERTRNVMIMGAYQDMMRRSREGAVFPYNNKNFLIILKGLLTFMSPEAISTFSHILPDQIREILAPEPKPIEAKSFPKPKLEGPMRPSPAAPNALPPLSGFGGMQAKKPEKFTRQKYDNHTEIPDPLMGTDMFIEEITSKFTVRALLSLFGLPMTGQEPQDRYALETSFLWLQEALADYNSTTKQMKKNGTFQLMCRLRGFVMMYYNRGASFDEAVALFVKTYPNEIGKMASRIAMINIGNFICGVACLMKMCQNKPDVDFLYAVYRCADFEGAYTLPSTLDPIYIPNALPYPVAVLPAGIIKSQKQTGDQQKFLGHFGDIGNGNINLN